MTTRPPRSARRYSLRAALLARRAARAAAAAAAQGQPLTSIATVVATHQAAAAVAAQTGVADMLAEQGIDVAADAVLNPLAFTTSLQVFEGMVDVLVSRQQTRVEALQTTAEPVVDRSQVQFDAEFERLVESLVQDAGRAAENAAIAVREDVRYVRLVTPPCCSRCAILAGRVYRYSQGFLRHPNCDCVMVPVTDAEGLVEDPLDLMRRGLVTGLSKADVRAIVAGADFNQVVNIRLRRAGLRQSGRVLVRRGRLTPEGIYARARSREEALELLAAAGYIF